MDESERQAELKTLPEMSLEHWEDRAGQELEFWDEWIQARGMEWTEDYNRRLDTTAPLFPEISVELDAMELEEGYRPQVLDIGCGPLSGIGATHREKPVTIVAVEALAEQYSAILTKNGISKGLHPISGTFETCAAMLGNDRFDVVWCCNSLDHSTDPLLGLYNLLSVVKSGGSLLLLFQPNEADRGSYEGLHQWNLDVTSDDEVVLSQMGRSVSMQPLLMQQDVVEIIRQTNGSEVWRFIVKVKKSTAPNLSQAVLG